MKLIFLGTRGQIEARTLRHQRHTATMIVHRRRRIMIDCGADWIDDLPRPLPHAIALTHAHFDHAWGLAHGSPCPVYATRQTWRIIDAFPIRARRLIVPRRATMIEGVSFQAFEVEHSTRCPAVCYRIVAGRAAVAYAPDVAYIPEHRRALRGVQLYIGDGATMSRTMIRRQGDRLTGHTTIRAQLGWCEKNGVPYAIFTHCGQQIVADDERKLAAQLRRWGRQRGVEAGFAYDGMELILRG